MSWNKKYENLLKEIGKQKKHLSDLPSMIPVENFKETETFVKTVMENNNDISKEDLSEWIKKTETNALLRYVLVEKYTGNLTSEQIDNLIQYSDHISCLNLIKRTDTSEEHIKKIIQKHIDNKITDEAFKMFLKNNASGIGETVLHILGSHFAKEMPNWDFLPFRYMHNSTYLRCKKQLENNFPEMLKDEKNKEWFQTQTANNIYLSTTNRDDALNSMFIIDEINGDTMTDYMKKMMYECISETLLDENTTKKQLYIDKAKSFLEEYLYAFPYECIIDLLEKCFASGNKKNDIIELILKTTTDDDIIATIYSRKPKMISKFEIEDIGEKSFDIMKLHLTETEIIKSYVRVASNNWIDRTDNIKEFLKEEHLSLLKLLALENESDDIDKELKALKIKEIDELILFRQHMRKKIQYSPFSEIVGSLLLMCSLYEQGITTEVDKYIYNRSKKSLTKHYVATEEIRLAKELIEEFQKKNELTESLKNTFALFIPRFEKIANETKDLNKRTIGIIHYVPKIERFCLNSYAVDNLTKQTKELTLQTIESMDKAALKIIRNAIINGITSSSEMKELYYKMMKIVDIYNVIDKRIKEKSKKKEENKQIILKEQEILEK